MQILASYTVKSPFSTNFFQFFAQNCEVILLSFSSFSSISNIFVSFCAFTYVHVKNIDV